MRDAAFEKCSFTHTSPLLALRHSILLSYTISMSSWMKHWRTLRVSFECCHFYIALPHATNMRWLLVDLTHKNWWVYSCVCWVYVHSHRCSKFLVRCIHSCMASICWVGRSWVTTTEKENMCTHFSSQFARGFANTHRIIKTFPCQITLKRFEDFNQPYPYFYFNETCCTCW